jgi:hypothetical protein
MNPGNGAQITVSHLVYTADRSISLSGVTNSLGKT